MPPRRRPRRGKEPSPEPDPSPSPEPEVEEQEEEEGDAEEAQDGSPAGAEADGAEGEIVSLQFDEPLTWRPGKPIPVSQLLPRLQRLFDELNDMDQDRVDKDSLTEVAHALAQRNLLQHKEPPIKAYVAVCLVEILRVCAPDAPFTEEQLKVSYLASGGFGGWPANGIVMTVDIYVYYILHYTRAKGPLPPLQQPAQACLGLPLRGQEYTAA